MHLLWLTHIRFGVDMCQTTELQAAAALSRCGWRVTFVSPYTDSAEEVAKSAGHDWIPVHTSKIRGLQSISLGRSIRRILPKILADGDIDAILAEWTTVAPSAKLLSKQMIPWLVDDRSPPVDDGIIGRLQWLHYSYSWRKVAKRADGFSVITPELNRYVQHRFKPVGPMVFWPSAVEPSRFSQSQQPESDLIRLVYCGSLEKSRGVLDLVEVVEHVRSFGHQTELLMFGAGGAFQKLSELSAARPWFELRGKEPPEAVPELLASCHIGLIPLPDQLRWRFSSPLKLFEYAATGLATVATYIPAHSSIGARQWLVLVNPENIVIEMAAAINDLIDRGNWQEIATSARSDANSEFTWDAAIGDLDSLLKDLVRKGDIEHSSGRVSDD